MEESVAMEDDGEDDMEDYFGMSPDWYDAVEGIKSSVVFLWIVTTLWSCGWTGRTGRSQWVRMLWMP